MSQLRKNSNKKSSYKKKESSIKPKLLDEQQFSRKVIEPDPHTKLMLSSDSEDDTPPDFDYLLKLPSSAGSHFLLKAEEQKFNQQPDLNVQLSKQFYLDTNILNLALQSIPFNERHETFNILWNAQELEQMKEEATSFEKKYHENLQKVLSDSKVKENALRIEGTAELVPNMEAVNLEQSFSSGKNDKESIQKWLDDILEI